MTVLDEKATRQAYHELAIEKKCEREYLQIVNEIDQKLLFCRDPAKRSDIAKVGIMKLDMLFRYLGSKGDLVIDNTVIIAE
jgi:hypothetical protein